MTAVLRKVSNIVDAGTIVDVADETSSMALVVLHDDRGRRTKSFELEDKMMTKSCVPVYGEFVLPGRCRPHIVTSVSCMHHQGLPVRLRIGAAEETIRCDGVKVRLKTPFPVEMEDHVFDDVWVMKASDGNAELTWYGILLPHYYATMLRKMY